MEGRRLDSQIFRGGHDSLRSSGSPNAENKWRPPNCGVGADLALFVSDVAPATGDAFVEFGGLIEAGHATHSQCCAVQP
jgi:hypothetical protein